MIHQVCYAASDRLCGPRLISRDDPQAVLADPDTLDLLHVEADGRGGGLDRCWVTSVALGREPVEQRGLAWPRAAEPRGSDAALTRLYFSSDSPYNHNEHTAWQLC